MTPLLRALLATLLVLLPLTTAAPAGAVEPGIATTGGETFDVSAETAALGADWQRIFVDWSLYEPLDNAYNSVQENGLTAKIAAATARAQKVLLVPVRSPAWASGNASDANVPPKDPGEYREFLVHLATQHPDAAAYEVWNEPDEPGFWNPGPDPAAYAALLNAAHDGVKSVKPSALVIVGGLVANDYRFLEQVLSAGGTRFDAVGVHTDTACLTSPADEQYREPDGRIGRFSFTGYREIRQSLLARGLDRPIWMTELGWSTLTSTCTLGGRAGTKPSGVTPELQAQYLSQAYACLQRDAFVTHAFWFSLQDLGGEARYDHYLGLRSPTGARKPAWDAFRAFATASPRPAVKCASDVDLTPPAVTVVAPTTTTPWLDKLTVKATATDDQAVQGMELWADGKKIGGKQSGGSFDLEWNGARELATGPHTLLLKAFDTAMNVGETTVVLQKADPTTFKAGKAQVLFALKRGKGRRITVTGKVVASGSAFQPKGKVRFFFEYRKTVRRGRRATQVWSPFSRFTKDAKAPFRFSLTLRKPGTWRAYARYAGLAPFRPQRTDYTVLNRVR